MFKNNLITALTLILVFTVLVFSPIIDKIQNSVVNPAMGIFVIILAGVAIWLAGYLIIGLIVSPLVKYRNPVHYNYKTKTVTLGDGVTKYCAIVQTEIGGHYRYIIKDKKHHDWFSGRYEYGIFDEIYNIEYCSLSDKQQIYYDTEADALFAIKEFKIRVESEYKSNKAYKQKKEHEKEMMRERSSKTTTVKFENNG